jgi:hypothetical protein
VVVEVIADPEIDAVEKGAPFAITYPVIGWRNNPASLMVCSTDQQEFQARSSLRKFHSIAALCGDGLRPELQALFKRLAVNPHIELFTRNDGMLQAGPDPTADEAL